MCLGTQEKGEKTGENAWEREREGEEPTITGGSAPPTAVRRRRALERGRDNAVREG
jgi:hypothetical protein